MNEDKIIGLSNRLNSIVDEANRHPNGNPGQITWDKAVYAIEALSEETNSKIIMPKVFADWDFDEHECCDCYELEIQDLIIIYLNNNIADSDNGRSLLKWIYENDFTETTTRLLKCIDAIRYGYEVEK